jgi:competence protein ComEA
VGRHRFLRLRARSDNSRRRSREPIRRVAVRVCPAVDIFRSRNAFQPRRLIDAAGPRLALGSGDPDRLFVPAWGLDLFSQSRVAGRGPSLHKEDSMFRTVLSIVAVSCLLGAGPSVATAQSRTTTRSAAKPPSTAIVNLNSATTTDLEGLPGIGAKTAARILEYRQKNGPFKKVEELMNVRGVGEKNFLKLKPQLTVAPAKADRDHPGVQ